eukprot:13060297-Alexandrium_andersonii.AAC.1
MSASLVGSEMCIRDSAHVMHACRFNAPLLVGQRGKAARKGDRCEGLAERCLLYTSDAADDM